jgi:hypothetical protein
VLAKTDSVAIAVLGVAAFRKGIDFRLSVRRRPRQRDAEDEEDIDPFFEWHPLRRQVRPGQDLPPELLRFGVQFSDGRKATTVGLFETEGLVRPPEAPPSPVLMQGGGHGGGGEWESDFWLWPLPPPGPFAFVVEWPREQIALTRQEVDADIFVDASSRSEVLWPEQGGSDGVAVTSFTLGG